MNFTENGLKLSGKKAELQERLRGHFLSNEDGLQSSDDFDDMDDESLRDACIARGLSDSGSRKVLLKRIRDDTAYANELLSANVPRDKDAYLRVSEALAVALKKGGSEKLAEIMESVRAKENSESKYIDIVVKSIGMTPEKFTAGGAPSVTADVLRKLAGDPLGDEPKYGKV